MAGNSNRPLNDKVITFDDISINMNGLTTTGPNWRNPQRQTSDGFVYTCSTYKDLNGNYNYNYEINQSAGIYIDNINGVKDDQYRYSDYIRVSDTGEGMINAHNGWDPTVSQLDGDVTAMQNFVYNEGFSATLNNKKADEEGIALNGGGTYDVVGFYDKQTDVYSDQLIKVRNLQGV